VPPAEDASRTAGFCSPRIDPFRGQIRAAWAAPALHFGKAGQSRPFGKKADVTRIKFATAAMLLAANLAVLPAPAMAAAQGRRDRYEDKWDRREDRRDRREDRRDRREDRWDRREDRWDARDNSWDPARHYRRDVRARRLGRHDRIYRGSDNRYYCKRDDGTTGLIVGGIAGGVLGHVIAPRGSKTLGTIIGAGGGALLGRAVDDGDIVCR
jgi:hypothetical protein